MSEQLGLPIQLREGATFANFIAGDNLMAIDALCNKGEPLVYLWGDDGAGKSHLMQACCHAHGPNAIYLSMSEMMDLSPEILSGMENYELIALDDIDLIADRHDWQEALFHLFNRLRDAGGLLRVTASLSPAALEFELADLISRLSWGVTVQLRLLSDEEKVEAIRFRAAARGMQLSADAGAYLIRRLPRKMTTLMAFIDHIDGVSLAAQRRLTIPFLKEQLERIDEL